MQMDIFSSFSFRLLQKHTFISCFPGGPTTLLMDQLCLPAVCSPRQDESVVSHLGEAVGHLVTSQRVL